MVCIEIKTYRTEEKSVSVGAESAASRAEGPKEVKVRSFLHSNFVDDGKEYVKW